MPAVASTALAGLLDGPPRPARVVAAGARAAYLEVGRGAVVAVVARDAVWLPCALVVDGEALRPAALRPGDPASVGAGAVVLGGGQVGLGAGEVALWPARWWDPHPRLGAVGVAALAGRVTAARRLVPPWPAAGLAAAVRARLRDGRRALEAAWRSGEAGAAAARSLVGLGPGSTPSGDDLLAGALAGARLLGAAAGAGAAVAAADALWASTRPLLERTTHLSAALLVHAARGEVCSPAAELCRALAGGAALRPAVGGLLAVGHTSGHDLATGLLLGARAVLRGAP